MRYYFAVLLSCVLSFVFISDKFDLIDFSEKNNALIKSLEEDLKIKIIMNDRIFFKFLPNPHLIISDVSALYDGQIICKASNIILNISLVSFLSSFFTDIITKASTLEFDEGYVRYDLLKKYFEENDQTKNGFSDKDFKLKFSLLNIDSGSEKLNIINSIFEYRNDSSINGYGQAIINKQNIDYALDVILKDSGSDINLSLNHKTFNLKIFLEEFLYSDFKLKKGNLDLQIIDLRNELPNQASASDNDLELSCNIKNDGDGEITLDSLNFKGKVIEKPALSAKLYKVANGILELQFRFYASTLYLDAIEDSFRLSDLSVNQAMQYAFDSLSISDHLNLNLNMKIDKINIGSTNMSNFDLSTYTVMGRTLIERLNLDCPGNSKLRFSGMIFGNKIRQKLNGFVEVQSDNAYELISLYKGANAVDFKNSKSLNASTAIFAMQNIFKASDLKITMDKMVGDADIILYEVPYSAPVKRFFIRAKNLDLDEIGFTNALDMHIKKLYEADDDKSGEKYFKLTNADSWLRKFNKQLNIDLTLHNLYFRDKNIEDVNMIIDASSSLLYIKSLHLDDKNLKGDVELKFKLPVLRPQIILKTDFDFINLDFLISILPSEKYLGKYDPRDKSINFYSANSYDARFNIKANEIKIDEETTINQLKACGSLKLGYLLVEDMSFDAWHGNIKSNFGIVVSTNTPVFNLSFNIYNIDPHLPMKYITSLDKIHGYMSIAGILKGKGNLRGWGNNQLYGKAEFAGARITWDGFDLLKIVDITDENYTTESKLQGLDYYSQYGTSVFDSINGSMDIVNGVVKMQNIQITNERISGVGSINYDLFSKEISSVNAFAFIPVNSKESITITTKMNGQLPHPKENTIDISKVEEFIKKPLNNNGN